ncbi:MAG: hypothetical protein IT538_15395, partial [Variibacter sp.]|nr:hypothetical protein [Variibacter sp.]
WPGAKRADASAESYTAEEMVRIQRDLGRIARYTVEMGGDIELFELAMRIPPWERLRSLSQTELRRMRLQSIEASAETPTQGIASNERTPRAPRLPMPERGWQLSDQSPAPTLLRRHALTLEGDEIGQFELSLACGEAGRAYKVTYADARQTQDPSSRLKDVTLWVGGERVPLHLQSSAPHAEAAELKSVATGILAAATLDKFRRDSNNVMVVGTKSGDGMRTSIRVGSAGFAREFSRLADSCGKSVVQLAR